MGRWLAALRSEKKSEIGTDANRQNRQNLTVITGAEIPVPVITLAKGFEGFEGSGSGPFVKIAADPGEGFEGFEGRTSEQIRNFNGSGWDDEDWQVAFDERAAILEYDEGLSRPDAARLARQQIDQRRRGKWH